MGVNDKHSASVSSGLDIVDSTNEGYSQHRGVPRKSSFREYHDLSRAQTSPDMHRMERSHEFVSNPSEFENLDPLTNHIDGNVTISGLLSMESSGDGLRVSMHEGDEETLENPQVTTGPGKRVPRRREKPSTRVMDTPLARKEMMDEHPSYHNEISGEEAEKRLKKCCTHGYLTRYSKHNQHYVLSVYQKVADQEDFKHFQITITSGASRGKYRILEDESFESLQAMLGHYGMKRISPGFRTIGNCVSVRDYLTQLEQTRAENVRQQQAPQQVQIPVEQLPRVQPQPKSRNCTVL